MRVAVVGATGFVGSKLVRTLADAGHQVVAISRRPTSERSDVRHLAVDIADEKNLGDALEGIETAYYLVHSMGAGAGFAERDRLIASTFARVARDRGVGRIVYVGALGAGDLSTHLSSRQEVGDVLRSTGIEVVELRAAVVLGAGSISFEMLRYLVERLPLMVAPRWLRTKLQPIAAGDLQRYLVGSLVVAPGVYEIGGDVTTYEEMIALYAKMRGLRRRRILKMPVLSLRLSAYWVDLITPVDRRISHTLIESLASEVLAHDRQATDRAFGFEPLALERALRQAVLDQEEDVAANLFDRQKGLESGVYTVSLSQPAAADIESIRRGLSEVGGDLRWYGAPNWWRLRLAAGRVMGEDTVIRRPDRLEIDAQVDWWVVADVGPDRLVLRAARWIVGDAWLGYRVRDGVELSAAFRPRGIPGLAYWKLLTPIHRFAFRAMLRRRAAAP